MTNRSNDNAGFRFRNLLIPTDQTPASNRILGRVVLLPLARDARLTLLHVIPGNLPEWAHARAELDAQNALAEEAGLLARRLPDDVSIVPMVMAGTPASIIASCCAETNAEMIVLGRGAGGTVRDKVLGSTAQRVLRQARVPVLVVRLPARAPYSRPALALEFDGAAAPVVQQLLKVLPAPRPPVDVIHAYDPPYQGLKYSALHEEDAEEFAVGHQRGTVQQIATILATALATARVPSADAPEWKTHVKVGTARSIIPKATKKASTDLLALGTRGHSGLAFAFLGSVAGDVLRAVTCDVLVVPPNDGE